MPTDLTPRRWVEFAEIDNVRDLGGLPVRGGGTTRFGIAYRSSTPQQVSEADLARLLGSVGLRTLIDLRTSVEVAREGYGRLAQTAVRLVHLPVAAGASTATPAELVPDARTVDLPELYGELLRGSAESLVGAVRLIADSSRHAVLFHCAAGKDRTGLLAALLLDAVGVTAEAIAADYALTERRIDRVRARLDALASYRGLPPPKTGILAVDPAHMRRFLGRLHAEHGGAARWLCTNGLAERELAALRRTMIG